MYEIRNRVLNTHNIYKSSLNYFLIELFRCLPYIYIYILILKFIYVNFQAVFDKLFHLKTNV